jgi:hypothetical protein
MKQLLKLLLLALPMSANAAGGVASGFFTLDSVDSDDVAAFDDDGSGFGAAFSFVGKSGFGFYGDYATTRLDDSRQDVAILRGGVSYGYSLLPSLTLTGKGEALHVNTVGSDTGYGFHGEAAYTLANVVSAFARLGYVEAGDISGMEYSIGGSVPLSKTVKGIVEYRVNSLKSDSNDVEADLGSIRLGIGVAF